MTEMKNEEWYVILNMNCQYEICRMCPKSGLFKGSYEECEKWIEQKEREEKQIQALGERCLQLQKDKGNLTDKVRELEQQIEKMIKENAELKTKKIPQLERKIASIRGCHRVDLAKLKARIEQVERLKKENADLKAKNKWYSEQVCNKECAEVWGNLNKAKDIIEKLIALYLSPVVTKDDVKRQDEILAEVEQFLNSEVEK